MDKSEIEKYRRQLEEIESKLTDDVVKTLSTEEKKEYIILVSQIKARLELLENL
jgi:prolyl-tRNA editing enzyme YbaK/EbsC (Cys-tRNA(Pro) deacylase)